MPMCVGLMGASNDFNIIILIGRKERRIYDLLIAEE